MRHAFAIDRGGTFTDALHVDLETGVRRRLKVPSSDDSPLVAIRALLGLSPDAPIPPAHVRVGSTIATNALLERKGVPTLLVTTRGLGDVAEIGDQTRPELFALDVVKPRPLHAEVLEVDARVAADGTIVRPLDESGLVDALRAARARGLESVAIVLLHAVATPADERRLGELAREAGFAHVSLSHRVAPLVGLVRRLDTTILDAYLTPVLGAHLDALQRALPGSRVELMQSSGGLARPEHFRAPAALLSGPAGGVIGARHVAGTLGLRRVVALDMGGTSTDVSRLDDGQVALRHETRVDGVRVATPLLAIDTVAAGGGSICRYVGHRLVVGPESAGASPGPACHGHGDTLTLTDVALLLGRLAGDHFPFPLDHARAARALDAVVAAVHADRSADDPRPPATRDAILAGLLEVATSHVAEAIRRVSIARGHDVRDDALLTFGGAGGLLACPLADALGVELVVAPSDAGVLSALGIGLAPESWRGVRDGHARRLDADGVAEATRLVDALAEEARAVLPDATWTATIELRSVGADVGLERPFFARGPSEAGGATAPTLDALLADFHAAHARELGYARPEQPVELVAVRLVAEASRAEAARFVGTRAPVAPAPDATTAAPHPKRTTRLFTRGAWREGVPVFDAPPPGARLDGPALVVAETHTLVVDAGFALEAHASGALLLRRTQPAPRSTAVDDPLRVEVTHHAFMSIAEGMGEVLRRTAASTNIKDRLDFSAAVFDADAALVANAPHIPVHLGAMSETVRAVAARHPDLEPGDVVVSNDPALGGSHLPDITVVTPIFGPDGARVAWVANRGHHADVGGLTPGSMPPGSTTLEDEGVVLSALVMARGGRLDEAALEAAFLGARWPARRYAENRGDLLAQLAANQAGVRRVEALLADRGAGVVQAAMRAVRDSAARRVRDALAVLPPGRRTFADALDDGTPIVVTVERRGDRLAIDFTGSGDEHPGNLNAPRAVTVAAVIYALRTLVRAPIPLNQGCLDPVDLTIPPRSVLDPSPGCAVAAGNVETSQRVVDVLLGALGVAAASQGTMNNLSFGDARFGYYETIAGGAGATARAAGASAVHTHMTNTRITDAELLEARFPVRLHRFAIRRGSGGRGAHAGGDGVVRELEALAPLTGAIISERRRTRPFGLEGGEPGRSGVNLLDGHTLDGRAAFTWPVGARLVLETPGGGGFGAP